MVLRAPVCGNSLRQPQDTNSPPSPSGHELPPSSRAGPGPEWPGALTTGAGVSHPSTTQPCSESGDGLETGIAGGAVASLSLKEKGAQQDLQRVQTGPATCCPHRALQPPLTRRAWPGASDGDLREDEDPQEGLPLGSGSPVDRAHPDSHPQVKADRPGQQSLGDGANPWPQAEALGRCCRGSCRGAREARRLECSFCPRGGCCSDA